jgi:hypothetical protein
MSCPARSQLLADPVSEGEPEWADQRSLDGDGHDD